MITTTVQKALIPLTEDEYFYLSERFEPLTAAELEQGVIQNFGHAKNRNPAAACALCAGDGAFPRGTLCRGAFVHRGQQRFGNRAPV